MAFEEFLNQAWTDHATQTDAVANRIRERINQVASADEIAPLATLIAHVYGEHLARWQDGLEALNQLKHSPHLEKGSANDQTISRFLVSLEIASGARSDVSSFNNSDQIRILATAASFISLHDSAKAEDLFQQSTQLAAVGLAKTDPANRALAVIGNNLAANLEEKSSRTTAEKDFMVRSAQVSRKFWEIAGTWLEVERAEYRVSQSFLKAGDARASLEHARRCLDIAGANQAPSLEYFFGFEALAGALRVLGNLVMFADAVRQAKSHFEKLSPADQAWCEPLIKKLIS